MKKKLFYQIIMMLANAFIITPCYAQLVSSKGLINNAGQYDGEVVTYQGEAIGDIMIRKDHAWVNLYDGYAAIGAWIKNSDTKYINYLGGYRAKGDFIEVIGIFNRSCPEHGGDLDIHVQEIKKILAGKSTLEQLNVKRLYTGLFLTLASLFLYSINKFLQKKP